MWRRIRKRPKGEPDTEVYRLKKELLRMYERQAKKGIIDLFYGDETQFSELGYSPYGWQLKGENVSIKVKRGAAINCFGIYSKDNRFIYKLLRNTIKSDVIIEALDELSWSIKKITVIVLDNARIHTSKKVKALLSIWRKRGLYIFRLPPYSPQLNAVERLWKELKEGWLRPKDYLSTDDLFFAVNRICSAVGTHIKLAFQTY